MYTCIHMLYRPIAMHSNETLGCAESEVTRETVLVIIVIMFIMSIMMITIASMIITMIITIVKHYQHVYC